LRSFSLLHPSAGTIEDDWADPEGIGQPARRFVTIRGARATASNPNSLPDVQWQRDSAYDLWRSFFPPEAGSAASKQPPPSTSAEAMTKRRLNHLAQHEPRPGPVPQSPAAQAVATSGAG